MGAVLKGFPFRAMEEPHSCGPAALCSALEHIGRMPPGGLAEIERLWRFRRGSDRTDTPGHHLGVLRALGVPYAIRSWLALGDLERALAAGSPVVALLATGRLLRHWVVVTGVEEEAVSVAWGDGPAPRELARPAFEAAFTGGPLDVLLGTRRLAYAVGDGAPWRSSKLLELYFRLQRPLAEHLVVPAVESRWLSRLRGGA